MSAPPPYRPRTALHDENLPPYTETQRRASQQSQPPPEYSPSQAHPDLLNEGPHSDLPYIQELSNTGSHDENPPLYTEAQRRASQQSQRPPEYSPSQQSQRPPGYTPSQQQPQRPPEYSPSQQPQRPPEYSPSQAHPNSLNEGSNPDISYIQHSYNTAPPPSYTLPTSPDTSTYRETRANLDPSSASSPLPSNSRKSTWRRLKEENELRKARIQHVTHAQAAAMLGHDAEWQREREGWAMSAERFEEMQRERREVLDFEEAAARLGCDAEWLRESVERAWEEDERARRELGSEERWCVVM